MARTAKDKEEERKQKKNQQGQGQEEDDAGDDSSDEDYVPPAGMYCVCVCVEAPPIYLSFFSFGLLSLRRCCLYCVDFAFDLPTLPPPSPSSHPPSR